MSARERILDAAAQIMRNEGIGRATTKEIARVANCSEALLYKHFADKTEIFLKVIMERSPQFGAVLEDLARLPGAGTVQENLCRVARSAIDFYVQTFPIGAGIFSDRTLLESHREGLRAHRAGPARVNDMLVEYLEHEQGLGRISRSADASGCASLLLGACLQQAFFSCVTGDAIESPDDVAGNLVEALCSGLGVTGAGH